MQSGSKFGRAIPASKGSTDAESVDAFIKAQNEVEDFVPVEYKVVKIHSFSNDLEGDLNALGAEGWDLMVWDGGIAIFTRC